MFDDILNKQFPGILSQACRDRTSPHYGCFDRNWWHYRIRDFASIMLQQGGYTVYEYSRLEAFSNYKEELRDLARAAAIFWNKRATRRGAFEEYYPWERGYPPLAFSSLAMAKLVIEEVIPAELIRKGLKKAARQLQHRFEYQAANQQVAGLAALAAIRKIEPGLVSDSTYRAIKTKTLNLQNKEGWFTEYDGPDLGYLSVTLDCLWDLYDLTGEQEYLDAAAASFSFLSDIILLRQGSTGMHNARNTDYIVPYGICRFLETEKQREQCLQVLSVLYSNTESLLHFFHAIDDRYRVHYIGHSVARAQRILNEKAYVKLPEHSGTLAVKDFPESGYCFRDLENSGLRTLISTKKGGIITVFKGTNTLYNDFGWIITKGKKQYVNHWWSDKWKEDVHENTITIQGYMFPHSEKSSKPFLHIGLRVLSFFSGRALTKLLRNVLIFKSGDTAVAFSRSVEINKSTLVITDELKGKNLKNNIIRAGRASKRHVASADSWHPEDFSEYNSTAVSEEFSETERKVIIKTTIDLSGLVSSED